MSPRYKKMLAHASKSVELQEAGKIRAGAYMLADFTDLSFPYKNPADDVRVWVRNNGKKRLVITPGPVPNAKGEIELAYPYGIYPRLFLIWLTSELTFTKSRTIEVGASINSLRKQLGISSGGAQHAELVRQLECLFSARVVVFDLTKQDSDAGVPNKGESLQIADSWELWKTSDTGQLQGGMPATLTVTESFFKRVDKSAVPLVPEIVHELKSNPMRLDIYCWLVHRLYAARRRESKVTWQQLADQFGSGKYARLRRFKETFTEHLRIVRMYYPESRVCVTDDGLILRSSPRHIPPKGRSMQVRTVQGVIEASELHSA